MSAEQYQRIVNSLDKEIADLEKKKAAADKKAADNQKKASNVSISKNTSAAMRKNKMRQIENYHAAATKASAESATLAKKIADKKKKRNTASVHLQKEEQKERRAQDKKSKQIQQAYEQKIEELQSQALSFSSIPENTKTDTPEYDVFVSHAWEDKKDFVDEFVNALKELGLRVWYDTSEIKWGDSMRKRIDEGLKKSRFGVAVLSPNYIAEGKYWTKAELDGLFQLESINGKTLLPVWHNLTKKEVVKYSPIIASKLAMSTAIMTPQEIAQKLKEIIDNN